MAEATGEKPRVCDDRMGLNLGSLWVLEVLQKLGPLRAGAGGEN